MGSCFLYYVTRFDNYFWKKKKERINQTYTLHSVNQHSQSLTLWGPAALVLHIHVHVRTLTPAFKVQSLISSSLFVRQRQVMLPQAELESFSLVCLYWGRYFWRDKSCFCYWVRHLCKCLCELGRQNPIQTRENERRISKWISHVSHTACRLI